MHLQSRLSLALAVAALFASSAASAAGEKLIDWRQANQEERIDRGVADGALTGRETLRLERRSTRLDLAEDRALADGSLSKHEALRLNRAYNRQSHFIYRQKHDGQTR
jgi:hypothetical protein